MDLEGNIMPRLFETNSSTLQKYSYVFIERKGETSALNLIFSFQSLVS